MGALLMNKSKKAAEFRSKLICTLILCFIGVLFVLPFLWMISTSVKKPLDVFTYPIQWIPQEPQWQNYSDVWNNKSVPFGKALYNSFFISIVAIIGQLLISCLAAYAFAKINFKGKNVVFLLFLASMMIPSQVTVIPRFVLFKTLDIYNTFGAVIYPNWFNVTSIFLLKQYYEAVPNELLESAKIDGAGQFRIWSTIATPLTTVGITSVTILGFIATWNDFMNPLIFLVNKKLYPVTLAINYFYADDAPLFHLTMSAAVLSLIPILVIYIVCQKYFVQSIASSGIKG